MSLDTTVSTFSCGLYGRTFIGIPTLACFEINKDTGIRVNGEEMHTYRDVTSYRFHTLTVYLMVSQRASLFAVCWGLSCSCSPCCQYSGGSLLFLAVILRAT